MIFCPLGMLNLAFETPSLRLSGLALYRSVLPHLGAQKVSGSPGLCLEWLVKDDSFVELILALLGPALLSLPTPGHAERGNGKRLPRLKAKRDIVLISLLAQAC